MVNWELPRAQLASTQPLLLRRDLRIFLDSIQRDPAALLALHSATEREGWKYLPILETFASGGGIPNSTVELGSLDTAAAIAAFGYAVLSKILVETSNSNQAWQRCANIANHIINQQEGSPTFSEKLKVLLEQLIDPIVTYLATRQSTHDLAAAKLLRYKRWSETFCVDELRAATNQTGSTSQRHQVEKRLKCHFFRFLFQEGVEFVIEAQDPKGEGQVDIYSAKFDDGSRLVVEAKVYDGRSRDRSYVEGGVPQAAEYARLFGERYAYLLVYNIADSTRLDFQGVQSLNGVWFAPRLGREVRIAAVELGASGSPSQASKLTQVTIDLGEQSEGP